MVLQSKQITTGGGEEQHGKTCYIFKPHLLAAPEAAPSSFPFCFDPSSQIDDLNQSAHLMCSFTQHAALCELLQSAGTHKTLSM